jgi:hypothetical protein
MSIMKEIKFETIQNYCKNQLNGESPILTKKNILKLRPDHNLFHFQRIQKTFKFDILFYYDWFPHLSVISISDMDLSFWKKLYYIVKKSKKPDAREWDLFEFNKKKKMNLNQFLIYLISKHDDVQRYFQVNQKLCENCYKNQHVINIKNYSLCLWFYPKISSHEFNWSNCRNYIDKRLLSIE